MLGSLNGGQRSTLYHHAVGIALSFLFLFWGHCSFSSESAFQTKFGLPLTRGRPSARRAKRRAVAEGRWCQPTALGSTTDTPIFGVPKWSIIDPLGINACPRGLPLLSARYKYIPQKKKGREKKGKRAPIGPVRAIPDSKVVSKHQHRPTTMSKLPPKKSKSKLPALSGSVSAGHPCLKPQIGHNIAFQAPIRMRSAWVPSRACYRARVEWCGAEKCANLR